MPYRPCLRCGALTTGSYCPDHQPDRPSRQTPGRGRGAAARKFRAAVLAKAGNRCEAIEHGARCTVTDPKLLQAHHLDGLRATGSNDPGRGVCLCRAHHRIVERV